MRAKQYDVGIIGGGPVGINAALKASRLGKSAIIIDATPAKQFAFSGPTGLFSKALREASQKLDVKVLREMGIGDLAIWAQVNEQIKSIIYKSGKDNSEAINRARVPALRGRAEVIGSHGDRCEVQVTYGNPDSKKGGETILAKNVLLATGSRAVQLPCVGDLYDPANIDTNRPLRVFDSDTIKALSFLPRTVTIVGGGIIAVEFARIFAALQSRVTMLIRAKDIPSSLARVGIDRDIGIALQKDLQSSGVRLLFETEVVSAEESSERDTDGENRRNLQIQLKKKGDNRVQRASSDILLTATGRTACSRNLGLCELGGEEVLAPNGDVVVGPDLQTMVPCVYAAGDIVGAPQLASTGIKQAEAAITNMFGGSNGVDVEESCSPKDLLSDSARYPIGIWTIPEVSFVGLTQEAAVAQGLDVVEGVAKYGDTIRGHVHSNLAAPKGKREGGMQQLKMVVEREWPYRVIGVHIIGEDACELIHYGTTLVQGGKTLDDTLDLTYAAVTYHELFRNAALNALNTIEEDEWTRIYEIVRGSDRELPAHTVAVERLVAAGADADGAERISEVFDRLRYKNKAIFIKLARRWASPERLFPKVSSQ
jgi:NAD(P) transhydrogenase